MASDLSAEVRAGLRAELESATLLLHPPVFTLWCFPTKILLSVQKIGHRRSARLSAARRRRKAFGEIVLSGGARRAADYQAAHGADLGA